MSTMIHVHAQWDAEASVWVAESDDVPGLVTEAETLEALSDKLRVLIPELAQENGLPSPSNDGYPFHLSAERDDHTRLAIG